MKTELHVPSDLKFLTIVENWLIESLKTELDYQIDRQIDWSRTENRLRLVLVEAYSNVVRHAHQNQPNLPVLIRLELKDRDLSLEVWDSGSGFELDRYLAPEPEDFQEGGYGWLILHRLMDTVEYRLRVGEGKNCLSMKTSLETSQEAASQAAENSTSAESSSPAAPQAAPVDAAPADTPPYSSQPPQSRLDPEKDPEKDLAK
ncbi:MAG: anti-sigma regulatory factor [Leptolyngbyaceae cyanobacterium SM1_1_3]|nr:anti-sigma regulatory factor [Leptolyngbyaceae cyanobacterium SM1_1_3]NJM85274.1 anti-sigma regulatory factor [Leptolyngbyaceae cyanobacterium RM2_2_21]NJN01736.1 anti-sigma regulatory factor [Leptolyngbyaceae cyanobacterium RM1_1_2]NJO11279.1 anti-sigma regulatory factor [Leptolyngbyaceae cyanobacterium SL_1_1]